ncbi:MAG: protein translocase subunit SecF [Melioribacteraceae bacterium]|nr:protein translocase subunit SecF [Melioribacteraceae bacterium]MCO6474045.1 protein translocase subunit SecF [Melioribacteraceae bacterium]MDD3557102.1 protein translocase subunit SecF [Melioribacteraceae bacterium]
MQIFQNLNVDFLSKRKTAYIISGTLLVLGLLSLFIRGLELGIDFKGGSEIALQFEQPIDITEIRDITTSMNLGKVEVKTFGGETGVLIRTDLQEIPQESFDKYVNVINSEIDKIIPGLEKRIVDRSGSSITYAFENADTVNTLNAELFKQGFQVSKGSPDIDNTHLIVRVGFADMMQEVLREELPGNRFTVQKEDLVGPKIGDELKANAIIAVVLALIVILIYLGFRFKFIFAAGAVIALFHDVMITLGAFSLLYGLTDFLNLEISINVVAAFLTLVGYSINDTVIVFDRIRENLKIHKTDDLANNINKAINKTMPRTIVTSLTTLVVTFVLLVFGGEVLRGFAFTLSFGILIGTYSSVFVASPVVYEYAMKAKSKIQFS